jgi:uncharacterized protein YaiE (UPF0345 family)
MLTGEYEFGTADKEQMDILAGKVEVLLSGCDEWEVFIGGQTFFAPAQNKFKIKVLELCDYCCSYIKE